MSWGIFLNQKPKTMAYVYRHIRLDTNQPFYIGIGSDEKKYKRAYEKQSRNIHWKRIISKAEYRVEILLDDISWEKCCEKEIELINLYGRSDIGKGTLCNLTDGGDGAYGVIYSDERKKNKSLKMIGNNYSKGITAWNKGKTNIYSEETLKKISDKVKLSLTDERRKQLSEQKKGNKIWLGKKHTEDSKKKISDKAKGRPSWSKGKKGIYSEEIINKFREAAKLRPPMSEETKLKISISNKGRVAHNKGKKHSEESKLKMSLKRKGVKHSQEHIKKRALSRINNNKIKKTKDKI